MCKKKSCVVKEKLLEAQRFLEPFKYLVNAHMTSYITENYWETLPQDISSGADSLSINDLYEYFWSSRNELSNIQLPTSISNFFINCWKFSLASNYFDDLLKHEDTDKSFPGPMTCMSPKKNHEVSNLKEIVAYLCETGQSNCVIDVGGGKGYLGTSLVLEKRIQVLSIDSKPVNTKGAAYVFEKIEKKSSADKDLSSMYKQITAFVTPETNLKGIAIEHLRPASDLKICLTGLHVCGDLAPTCTKLFCKNQDVVSVCTIGCCYNLLTEKFEFKPKSGTCIGEFGFPLSDFLHRQMYSLGRNARMIACQSFDRICHEKRVMKPSLFWRAVLQVHLERIFGTNCNLTVGRRCSKASSLADYFLKAEQSLKINLKLSAETLSELCQETKAHYESMAKFYCFRLALAPVVETVIILDRLLFLHEQGVDNAYISKVFDGVKSPRCYAMIATKNE